MNEGCEAASEHGEYFGGLRFGEMLDIVVSASVYLGSMVSWPIIYLSFTRTTVLMSL